MSFSLDVGETLRNERRLSPELKVRARQTLRKVRRQMVKDYLLHPLLTGPSALHTLTANATANLIRNLWSHSVIMCGHFPEGVETFEQTELDEDETRGQWYLRQMLGSANISGSRLLHILAGNLSHQIEHHLFPDLPSNRYAEIAPQVRDLFERYDLRYHVAPLPRQVGSAWHKVLRLSLPNGWLQETTVANAPLQLAKLLQMTSTRGQLQATEPEPSASPRVIDRTCAGLCRSWPVTPQRERPLCRTHGPDCTGLPCSSSPMLDEWAESRRTQVEQRVGRC